MTVVLMVAFAAFIFLEKHRFAGKATVLEGLCNCRIQPDVYWVIGISNQNVIVNMLENTYWRRVMPTTQFIPLRFADLYRLILLAVVCIFHLAGCENDSSNTLANNGKYDVYTPDIPKKMFRVSRSSAPLVSIEQGEGETVFVDGARYWAIHSFVDPLDHPWHPHPVNEVTLVYVDADSDLYIDYRLSFCLSMDGELLWFGWSGMSDIGLPENITPQLLNNACMADFGQNGSSRSRTGSSFLVTIDHGYANFPLPVSAPGLSMDFAIQSKLPENLHFSDGTAEGLLDYRARFLKLTAFSSEKKHSILSLLESDVFSLAKLRSILASGADPNVRSLRYGQSPLILSVLNGRGVDVFRVLIEAGADPNIADDLFCRTALHYAIINGADPEVIDLLLSGGADPNVKDIESGILAPEWTGGTPLHYAVRDNSNVVTALIDGGADVNAKGRFGSTPLLYAAYAEKNPEIASKLIDSGAEVNATDVRANVNALHCALSNASPTGTEFIRVLIEAGVDVDARDNQMGLTPFMVGCLVHGPDVMSLVLAQGPDISIKDKRGNTALMYARENTSLKDTRFLKKLEALYEQY